MSVQAFDLIVIGSGPAGEKGAAQAACFGKRVALVEKQPCKYAAYDGLGGLERGEGRSEVASTEGGGN